MLYRFVPLLVSFVIIKYFMVSIEAKNETIFKVPSYSWSWTLSGTNGKVMWKSEKSPLHYYACVVKPPSKPNGWLRSHVFYVDGAKRVDVTVEYAVSNCSTLSYRFCKEYFNLYVYKTSISHTTFGYRVPDPAVTPEVYKLFGTTKPKVLTVGQLTKSENTETYSFLTNATTPNHYLAIQYTGGCFRLYGITVSYSVCQSLALPSGLIQLPLTVAPANGSIQVSGSCAQHAQPLANNSALYGYCKSDGEWSTNMSSEECWCDAGYGKYSLGLGAECKECPSGTYQDTASNSQCKTCPLSSIQDTNRTKCNCDARFYRTDKESIFNNCTAQPSAPQNLSSTFVNATFVTIVWSPPLNRGGRSDVYYEVECKQYDDEGRHCTKDCTGAVITHTTRTTRMATVQHLSAYTYYQLKVFAKNGVTHLAEKNQEKSKDANIVLRTNEGIPGTPVLKVKVLSPTPVLLSWTLQETNGVITYYQVIYYPVGKESSKKVLKTTNTSIIITGLGKEKKYFFQVRASTTAGLGQSDDTKIVVLPRKDGEAGEGTPTSFPGTPELNVNVLNSTSVLLSWTLQETNGVITFYQVTYYPVGEESSKKVLKTTNTIIIITGLIKEEKYFFQVRASTIAGLGQSGNDTKIVVLPRKDNNNNGEAGKDGEAGEGTPTSCSTVLGVCAALLAVSLLFNLLLVVFYIWRNAKGTKSQSRKTRTDDNVVEMSPTSPSSSAALHVPPSSQPSAEYETVPEFVQPSRVQPHTPNTSGQYEIPGNPDNRQTNQDPGHYHYQQLDPATITSQHGDPTGMYEPLRSKQMDVSNSEPNTYQPLRNRNTEYQHLQTDSNANNASFTY